MPSVSVLPLMGTAVGPVHQVSEAQLFESMAGGEDMSELKKAAERSTGEEIVAEASPDHGSLQKKIKDEKDLIKPSDADKQDEISAAGTESPSQSTHSYPPAMPSHYTPQQGGYYMAYHSEVTPEPPSPAGTGTGIVYETSSFLQQSTGFTPFAGHQYSGAPVPGQRTAGQAPPSPSQSSIPPASPLFPRMNGQSGLLDPRRMSDNPASQMRGAPLSPGPQYLSPALGPSAAMYAMNAYGVVHGGSMGGVTATVSSEEVAGWGDNRHQLSPYPQTSPQISAHGIPIPYIPGMPPRSVSAGSRSYSFDDGMLPQAVDSQQLSSQEQFVLGQISPGAGAPGALFAHQQTWGYSVPPPDMYGASASPLQPRSTVSYMGIPGGPPRHHGPPSMGPYGGQFYPATSPGPPIQTTGSNKGPDGANLFIFHIPNHFTNLDMYQLFCPYGNLLSVRIMVEKDTGRSRGFGFVSYDSPDAAALAIKELNGFAIGNKRLKVQHKQIRPSEYNDKNFQHPGYDDQGLGGAYGRDDGALPPEAAPSVGWLGTQENGMVGATTPDQMRASVSESGAVDPLSGMEQMRQALPEVASEN